MTTSQRPRVAACAECGRRMTLIRCGVERHERRRRSRAEQLAGVCPGRVYAHDANGAIDCPG